MRVLITGGAGFIGSHLVDYYLKQGHSVTVLDNLSTGTLRNFEKVQSAIRLFKGDIRDQQLVSDLVKESDLVLHMAAALGVNNILDSTIDSISVNFTGSEMVLNAATTFEKRIIIASTSEIYGKNPKQPLNEEDDRLIGPPQKVRWSYSDAKALEEAMAFALHLKKNLQVTTLRLFNTVGPRQTGKYGMVLPRFVSAAISNKPLTVYGDGSQTRVFCHVSDVVNAISQIADSSSAIGEVFNVGGTGETSIKELALRVIERTQSSSLIEYVPYESAYSKGYEDMQRRVPDISKLSKFLNWKPLMDLDSIIIDVSNYLKSNS